MNKHPDLFPETLLVSREGDRIYTTSLKVAEHFKKRHSNVLRDVDKLINELDFELVDDPDSIMEPSGCWAQNCAQQNTDAKLMSEFGRLNFEPSSYLNVQKKTQPMFKMTEEGFAILAMGFTGKKALEWKIKFLSAFREMERQLHARESNFIAALDQIRPYLRPVVEGTEQGMTRAQIAEPLGKTAAAVSYHRHQARRFGLLKQVH